MGPSSSPSYTTLRPLSVVASTLVSLKPRSLACITLVPPSSRTDESYWLEATPTQTSPPRSMRPSTGLNTFLVSCSYQRQHSLMRSHSTLYDSSSSCLYWATKIYFLQYRLLFEGHSTTQHYGGSSHRFPFGSVSPGLFIAWTIL